MTIPLRRINKVNMKKAKRESESLSKGILIGASSLLLICTGTAYANPESEAILRSGQVNVTNQNGKTVTGVVNDDLGPIAGANIVVKGTTNGTMTDGNGHFTLEHVPENAILQISFMGYVTQEMTVKGQNNLTVTLKEDSQMLDEVVVVGYGVQKKVNLSGAVQSVSGEKMANRPITNVNTGLQGLVPNLNI